MSAQQPRTLCEMVKPSTACHQMGDNVLQEADKISEPVSTADKSQCILAGRSYGNHDDILCRRITLLNRQAACGHRATCTGMARLALGVAKLAEVVDAVEHGALEGDGGVQVVLLARLIHADACSQRNQPHATRATATGPMPGDSTS